LFGKNKQKVRQRGDHLKSANEKHVMESGSVALEALALMLGLGMAGRIVAVIWPGRTKNLLKKNIAQLSDAKVRAMGMILIAAGLVSACFVFGALSLTQIAATVFTFSLLAGGCLLLVPRLARAFWREDLEVSDSSMRLLAAVTTLLGLALLSMVLHG
jgi:uncharacterized protein YjeT (DUF2065 family)